MRVIFFLSVALVAYVYAGYPLLLALARPRRAASRGNPPHQPTVSLIVAAHNEEAVLREKIDNSLALDYPHDHLQIVIASDGSDDATDAIAAEYASRGVVLERIRPRGGKTRALNLTVPRTFADVVVLSDANAMYRRDAIRCLVRHFADPAVGAVSGDVRVVDAADSYASSEGLYYRYERQVQRLESRFGSIVGADGAMYAIRRELFAPIPDSIVVDDFVISMNVARAGHRVLYDPEAIATEVGTGSAAEEFRRKVRIVAGGLQALMAGQGVPGWRTPGLLWAYVSHKLLRWLLPLPLLAALLASIALAGTHPAWFAIAGLQMAFYVAAGLRAVDAPGFGTRAAAFPYYFCLVNAAALNGLWRAAVRPQPAAWARTRRLERTL